MITKKSIVIAALLFVILAFSPLQHADAIQSGDVISLNWALWNTGSSGGEFTVSDYYTKNALFNTFCLEPREYFYINEPLTVQTIGTTIKYNDSGSEIPLDKRVAFLYHEFAHNSWNEPGIFVYGSRESDALLQSAIWYLQYGIYGSNNDFVRYANRYFESDGFADSTGDVVVMNLFGANGGVKQDQLALVPEPMTLLLLGTGLIGVAAFRRKIK
jgi:hypothetical protein